MDHLNFYNLYYLRRLVRVMLPAICLVFLAEHSFSKSSPQNKAAENLQADSSRFNISGRVVDNAGQPLAGATVFITNSTWSASTDSQGTFRLSSIPPGNYELLVRMIGFITFTKNFTVINKSLDVDITLGQDAIALNEVKISAKPDGNRARYLKIFTQNFIGESDNGRRSKITNTDVIKFRYDKTTGNLTATATDLVKVKNDGLGYDVNYLLNSFSYNEQYQTFGYNGKVYFGELKGDEKLQATWKNNRAAAYYGSMKHFLKALFAGSTEAEGFKIYRIADSELRQIGGLSFSGRGIGQLRTGNSSVNLQQLSPDSLIKIVDLNKKQLKLPMQIKDGDTSRVYICYTRKREPSRFYSSASHLNIPVQNAQISSLYDVSRGSILLNSDGSLWPENSVMIQGYWAWNRVADLLPKEMELLLDANIIRTSVKEIEPLTSRKAVEKIHIQTDRPWYLTGDTLWLKVYVVDANNKPATESKICFVELIDKKKRIVKNIRLPLALGTAWGELALSDSLLQKGIYTLRAYTGNTQKNDNAFFYKTIRLADLNSANNTAKGVAQKKPASVADSLKFDFFAEGGAFISDVDSRMAIMLTASGKPVGKLSGYIADEIESRVVKLETNANGISAFNLKPQKGAKYTAVIALPNGQQKRFALPLPLQGLAISIKQNDDDVVIHLNSGNTIYSGKYTLVAKSNNQIQYQTEKMLTSEKDSIVVSKTNLPAGILQFNLYNADKMLIAQRSIFSEDKSQQLNIKLTPDKTTYHPHDKVNINVALTDADGKPVSGSFSVAVNNEADVAGGTDAEKSIFSDLLWSSEGNGGVSKLNYDVTKLTAGMQRDLDDMLLTVRVKNEQGAQKTLIQQPDNLPKDTSAIIQGRVTTFKGKPAVASMVGLFFPAGGPVLTTLSDANGQFLFNNIPVKRGEPFYIVAKDKNKDLVVSVDKYEPPVIPDEIMPDTLEDDQAMSNNDYVAKRIEELKTGNIIGTELKEVLIKERKKEPSLKELVKQRSSNLGGAPDQTLTFIDLLGCNSSTLAECLAIKLNAVTATVDSQHRTQLFARGRNNGPMAVFVNGILRPDALTTLSAGEVASVEVLKGSNAAAYGLQSGNGVVVITTKDGGLDYWAYEQEHYVPGSTKTSAVYRYRFENGADEPRDFYTPDYNQPQPKFTDKWRPTLYWNPEIDLEANGTAKLSYFTNSAPGTYRVTIEGIDGTGRMARQIFKYVVQ